MKSDPGHILSDSFGRMHHYLRISLIEKCNLRCTYCMPEQGVVLSPKAELMTAEEVRDIAQIFVTAGVDKIRLTGGEPLLRKDFRQVISYLSALPVRLSMTTNGVLIDRFIEDLKEAALRDINISLDTLVPARFGALTKRDQLEKTLDNLDLLIQEGFRVKVNAVLIRGVNEDEVADLISLGMNRPIEVRFIEFMPFDGNEWDRSKMVSQADVISRAEAEFGAEQILPMPLEQNFTARRYKVSGFQGSFGIISTVTNPFCDTCNRLRLTANGRIKNCLFSGAETDILSAYRAGEDIRPLIQEALESKAAMRAGLDSPALFDEPRTHERNRSMTAIGG